MRYLDLTFATPAENLACDEVLLDWCEDGGEQGILRLWESERYFVVVGYANRVTSEVNLAACEAVGFPVLRRCSGGGTVLQGPGCINYSLILRIDETGPTGSVTGTNSLVMQTNRNALQPFVKGRIDVLGHTDLAIDGIKFSGNAQRRRRRFLLFHGSLLLDFDIDRIESLLPMPSQQPAYRQNRSHRDFLTNLQMERQPAKEALRTAWQATIPLTTVPIDGIRSLAMERYSSADWNLKF